MGWPASAPALAAPPSCAALGGAVEAGQMCRVRATGPTYTLNMTFPDGLPRRAGADRLHHPEPRRVRQRRPEFRAAATSPTRWRPRTEQHSSGQPPHNTRSVVLKFFQDLGGVAPVHLVQGVQLQPRDEAADHLRHAVRTRRGAAGQHLSDRPAATWNARIRWARPSCPRSGHDPSHYQNFAITDDQLIFYFAPGEMLPAFAGPAQAAGSAQRDPAAGGLTATV